MIDLGDHGEGDEEELAVPPPRRRLWQVVGVLGVLVVVAGIAVGLARGSGTSPVPTSTPSASIAAGPVIPTFGVRSLVPTLGLSTLVVVGRRREALTLPRRVPVLDAPCSGGPRHCRLRYGTPTGVADALRTLEPGCQPAYDEFVRRAKGRTMVLQRHALCRSAHATVLVNVVRVSSPPQTGRVDVDELVYVTQPHRPFSVQVFLLGRGPTRPDIGSARNLAADPRLLAGT